MSVQQEYPAAPNAYGAVTTMLPNLCGVLAAFASGYFAAVIVSDAALLTASPRFDPLVLSDLWSQDIPFQRKTAIAIVSMLALVALVRSLISSVAACMLHYDAATYDGGSTPGSGVTQAWLDQRRVATEQALRGFHVAVPLMALSLILLLDGALMSLCLYATGFWLINTLLKIWNERAAR